MANDDNNATNDMGADNDKSANNDESVKDAKYTSNEKLELNELIHELTTLMSEINRKRLHDVQSSMMDSINSICGDPNKIKSADNSDAFMHTYREALSKIIDLNSLSEHFIESYLKFNLEVMHQVAISPKTTMVEDIQQAIINSDYRKYLKTLSETISKNYIDAADFSFLKFTDIVKLNPDNKPLPRGMTSALNRTNASTADKLLSEENIQYDTEAAKFVAKDNTDNKFSPEELNLIFSIAYVINALVDSEFISAIELTDFMICLDETRTLASEHPAAKKIRRFLKEKAPIIDFDCEYYYHGRSREEGAAPYTFETMLSAPWGVTGPGRYNHAGQAFYYFSDQERGAQLEAKKQNKDSVIQIVKLRPIYPIQLVDLSGDLKGGKTFLNHIRFKATEPVPREYLIPCFVSDCCRVLGYDGIKYYGSKEYSNYVSWHPRYFEYVKMIEN